MCYAKSKQSVLEAPLKGLLENAKSFLIGYSCPRPCGLPYFAAALSQAFSYKIKNREEFNFCLSYHLLILKTYINNPSLFRTIF